MPRYFFHVQDGKEFWDDEGTEFADLQAARVAAVAYAGTLLSMHAVEFWANKSWSLDIADQAGTVVCTLQFLARASEDASPSPTGPSTPTTGRQVRSTDRVATTMASSGHVPAQGEEALT